ncbi:MAG: hypothetical protein OXM55_01385 [Bdellovibrionales bacterium]|nr:hypothetical protein [Bdellovibrionales bacterium]
MKKNILIFLIFSSVSYVAQSNNRDIIISMKQSSPFVDIDIDSILHPPEQLLVLEPEEYINPPAPSGTSCLHVIQAFRNKYPPLADVGNPPIHALVERKVLRAISLWQIPAPHNHTFHNYTCINEVRDTCWDYCGEGLEQPGNVHLYCVLMACMNYTNDPIDEIPVNYNKI